ncbi:MAG: VWA domain-containing protein, partial [Actinobacteria bacterium]|nr:VWA domain-containing protein [Actinomycetota bacterium]
MEALKRNFPIIIVAIFLFLALPVYANAQEDQDVIIKKMNIDEYPQVSIYLNFKEGSVLGSQDLDENNFTVLEDGKEVKDLSVVKVAKITEPIGVVLVLDTSGSMKGQPILDAQAAASLFLDEMRSIDEFAVVGFADQVTVYSTFTSNRQQLKDSIAQTTAKGETSLFDGIIVALEQFKDRENIKHRYLIVLSDGMDTVSKLTVQDAITKAQNEKVIVYSVALMSYDFNPTDINNISKSTGGEMLVAANSGELKELYRAISRKIRNQYKISYTSLWPNTETIDVSIAVGKSGIESLAKTSYKNPFYAPPPTKIVMSPQRPFYLAIFDKWWMKLILYAAFFSSITLFLYAFTLLIFPPRRILKQRTEFYGYKPAIRNLEDEIREKKGKVGFFDRIVILVSRLAAKRGFVELFELRLERAGMSIRGSEFMSLHLIAVIISSLGVYLLARNLLISLVVTLLVVLSPFILLNLRTSIRLRKFHDQLPDTLQLISGSLKAGYSFNQALSMVVEETGPPISDEFRRVLSEIRMGLPERDALENMARRMDSEHFNWTIMSINIQREVGGNLA